jgi:D-methionine transport system ATP-binding protein
MRTFAQNTVEGAIVYGGITEIGDRPFGSLTLSLTGAASSIDRALGELRTFTDVEEYPAHAGRARA